MLARLIFTVWIFLMCPVLYGQSIDVKQSYSFKGLIGKNIEGVIPITNTGSKPVYIEILRTELIIGTSQKTWFCWDNECYDESQNQMPLSRKIDPGETIKAFRSVLSSGISAGFSSIKYLISEKGNPANEVEIEVNYMVEEKSASASLLSNENITIKNMYPNPVNEFAIFEYTIHNPEKEVKIIIHSVLGSIIAEHNLQPYDTRLKVKTETYNPGVYFFTVYIENEGLMTRKFFIQR